MAKTLRVMALTSADDCEHRELLLGRRTAEIYLRAPSQERSGYADPEGPSMSRGAGDRGM